MQITGSFLCGKKKKGSRELPTFLECFWFCLILFQKLCVEKKKDYEKLWAVRMHLVLSLCCFSPFSDNCKIHKAYFVSMQLSWLFSFIELHISVEDIEMKC